MSGRESKFQKQCIDWCKANDYLAVNIHGGGWGNKGFPDLLVFGNGHCVAVELKNGHAYTQQPVQKFWEQKFEKVGIPYLLITTYKDFKNYIEREMN